MSCVPFFYYASPIYWIDDDPIFLQAFSYCLKENFEIKSILDPHEALKFFSNYQPPHKASAFLQACEDHEEYDLPDHLPVDFDFKLLRNLRYSSKKQKDIPVIIIDYKMPGMTGIELAEKLKAMPAKKILLTGLPDLQIAVDAFNKGLIDCFICKDNPNLDQELQNQIKRLQRQYFIDRSTPLLNHLESGFRLPQSDPAFADFFEKLCLEKNIIEYYLSDKNGGMLLVNSEGITQYLMIHTDRTLNEFIDLYENDTEHTFFLQSIKNRTKIPCFTPDDKEPWELKVSEWSNYFSSPNLLKGRENYYWLLINPEHISAKSKARKFSATKITGNVLSISGIN